jgi:phosphoglycolate phosphatase
MICSAFGITTDHPDFLPMREEFLDLYGRELCVDTVLFPGMRELLSSFEAIGIAWGVVTNKYERFAHPILETLGVAQGAGAIVGGDTCPRAKPFPDPLLFAARKMGVAPAKTLYVGDDERDVQAARAAGMPVLVAGYGYLGDDKPPAEWNGDAIVYSAAEIGEWIRAQSEAPRMRSRS